MARARVESRDGDEYITASVHVRARSATRRAANSSSDYVSRGFEEHAMMKTSRALRDKLSRSSGH